MRNDQDYLQHILDAIDSIHEFTENLDYQAFLNSELHQEAVIRKIEIIGEAVSNLPTKTKELTDKIPWRRIIDTRNKLIHDYTEIRLEMIWDIIKQDLPSLQKEIRKIISQLS